MLRGTMPSAGVQGRRVASAAVLAIVFGVVVAAPSPASARMLVGANVHAFFRSPLLGKGEVELPPAAVAAQVDRLAQAGADVVRLAVHWPLIEPEPGRFDQGYLDFVDAVMRRLRARHLKAVLSWGGVQCGHGAAPLPEPQCETESGRRQGSSYYPESDADVALYARRAAWIARRYHQVVIGIEPGNEPNNPRFFRNPGGPRVYVNVLRAAYAEIKRLAPRVRVIGGALALGDAEYLERLYAAGFGGTFDVLSIHPYDIRFAGPNSGWGSPLRPDEGPARQFSFFSGIPAVRAVMRMHGDIGKPLWLTEFGYETCPSEYPCVAPEVQARWIEDALRLAAARSDYIGLALVYVLQDYGDSFGGRTGLIDRAGEPKPALARVSGQWQDLRAHRYAAAELRRHGRPLALLEIRRRGALVRAHATRFPGLGGLPTVLCLTTGSATRCGAGGVTLDGVPVRLAAKATLRAAGARVEARLPGGR